MKWTARNHGFRTQRQANRRPATIRTSPTTTNTLVRRGQVQEGSETFGKAFENWIFHELSVHVRNAARPYELAYWRLSSGIEVGFVLGDAETAPEVKGKRSLHRRDTRHLLEFRKEHSGVKQLVVVCLELRARITDDGVRILPYRDFLDALWQGEFVARF